jgi:ACR3 family arsenite efflux pump ArsB
MLAVTGAAFLSGRPGWSALGAVGLIILGTAPLAASVIFWRPFSPA